MWRWGALVGGLILGTAALAEESVRFYQIPGPDGRMQTVRMPASETKSAAKADAQVKAGDAQAHKDKALPPPTAAAEAVSAKSAADTNASAQGPALAAPSGSAPGAAQPEGAATAKDATAIRHAPYDGDVYLDSDRLEQSGFNPEQKKKFFITSDGMRQRVEENLQPASEGSDPAFPLAPSANAAGDERQRVALFEEAVVLDVAALPDLRGLCIDVTKAVALQAQTERVREDARSLRFGKGQPVVAAYRIAGQGLRNIRLRSNASSMKAPGFYSPLLGFADARGCLQRAQYPTFQYKYSATKLHYEMLETEITLHDEEHFLLLLRRSAQMKEGQPQRRDYTILPYGQLSLKALP